MGRLFRLSKYLRPEMSAPPSYNRKERRLSKNCIQFRFRLYWAYNWSCTVSSEALTANDCRSSVGHGSKEQKWDNVNRVMPAWYSCASIVFSASCFRIIWAKSGPNLSSNMFKPSCIRGMDAGALARMSRWRPGCSRRDEKYAARKPDNPVKFSQ